MQATPECSTSTPKENGADGDLTQTKILRTWMAGNSLVFSATLGGMARTLPSSFFSRGSAVHSYSERPLTSRISVFSCNHANRHNPEAAETRAAALVGPPCAGFPSDPQQKRGVLAPYVNQLEGRHASEGGGEARDRPDRKLRGGTGRRRSTGRWHTVCVLAEKS